MTSAWAEHCPATAPFLQLLIQSRLTDFGELCLGLVRDHTKDTSRLLLSKYMNKTKKSDSSNMKQKKYQIERN